MSAELQARKPAKAKAPKRQAYVLDPSTTRGAAAPRPARSSCPMELAIELAGDQVDETFGGR